MSALYESIGNAGYKNLLADPQGADIITVPLKPASGVIPAGTILYRASTGLYEPAASAQIVATNMLVVNKETVDATEAGVAEDAVAFRAGCFVDGAVTLAAGAALTAAHKAVLRGQNIVFDKKVEAATFTNV